MQYKVIDTRRDFIIRLHNKLIKNATNKEQENDILAMITSIIQVLKNRSQFRTMQQELGVEMIFRGYIVENWFRSIPTNKYKIFNKIIVCECIDFYNSSWKHCNEIFYLKEKQYEFLLK